MRSTINDFHWLFVTCINRPARRANWGKRWTSRLRVFDACFMRKCTLKKWSYTGEEKRYEPLVFFIGEPKDGGFRIFVVLFGFWKIRRDIFKFNEKSGVILDIYQNSTKNIELSNPEQAVSESYIFWWFIKKKIIVIAFDPTGADCFKWS